MLGDGTSSHPLANGKGGWYGTGPIDLTSYFKKTGDHVIEISHPNSGGGKVRYVIVVDE